MNFLLGPGLFSGAFAVSFREGIYIYILQCGFVKLSPTRQVVKNPDRLQRDFFFELGAFFGGPFLGGFLWLLR